MILLLLTTGCSTEKNTLVTRTFHNVTSNYNIFFNGEESYKKGLKRLDDSYQDDFSRILPVFKYSDPGAVSAIAPDMERTIQKATKVITLHSITAKPEYKDGPQNDKQEAFYEQNEYNRFVPENYLLMAKAYLYRHDFALAIETLKYLLSEYHYEDIIYETQVWLARVYNEYGEYEEAADILDVLTGNLEFPGKLNTELYITLADHHLKLGAIDRAIDPLSRAVVTARKKDDKIRYSFILAQLHQETGQAAEASELYRQVIRMNPSYEFSFNARINRASVFMAGSEHSKEILDELDKMLRDEKNRDFQDQIYYAIGNVHFRGGNVEAALEYYKSSSGLSVSNDQQKTTSCLTIADIYYDRQDYEMADRYYDSAKVYLTGDHPDYEDIMKKTTSLSELVRNMQVIAREDSLQRLAEMSDQQRLAVIDSIITRITRAEQEVRQGELQASQQQQYNRMALSEAQRTGFGSTQGGSWYFYNQAAKGFGQPEFRMKWGNRKLEDNWRRANKREVTFGETAVSLADSNGMDTLGMQILSDKSREFYLRDIPFTDSLLDISNGRIETALYNAGGIYTNELNDIPRSVETYENLLERFPETDYRLSVYYSLYEIYMDMDKPARADIHRQNIVTGFPGSQPAQLLTNPDYINELMAEKNAVRVFYERTYQKYNQGYYGQVIIDADTAMVRFAGDPLIPKFQFLKVLSLGRTSDILVFTQALDSLAASTPDQEIAGSARDILAYILASDEEVKTETRKIEAEEIYAPDTSGVFFYGMIITPPVDINQLKFEFINFNLDHYPNRTFDVVDEMIQSNNILLLVKQFPDPGGVWSYHDQVAGDELIFGQLENTSFQTFIISSRNADTLLVDRDIEKYLLFFQKHYTH